MTIGEVIKQLREERDWTQDQLADNSGVDRNTIASIETGKSREPTITNLLKLAQAFGKRPEDLYFAAGYIAEPPHRLSSQELLQRFMISLPESVPVYAEYPVHAGKVVKPVDYAHIERNDIKRNLEGYIVTGTCLLPDVKEHDVVIIDRDAAVNSGDIVVCVLDGQMHLARYKMVGGQPFLENNNGRTFLEEDCQPAAPVIEVRRRLK
jgi:transcriptional regulator with XRE-family HTH domain